jgi:homoserine O-acetyltransferase/O-succinyltransferase
VERATAALTQRVVLYTEDDPLVLDCGRELAPVEVAYETYGTLDAERSNAVFVCHALTGDAHAAAPDGWWKAMVGPRLPVDTERYFVISPNLLGGCRGTTGPSSIDPHTGRSYGLDFPPLTIRDLVAVHRRLLAHLGVESLHGALGGSLGGMQVLQWLLDDPGQVRRAGLIAASSRLTAENIALSAAARHAILSDPDFHDGAYIERGTFPAAGLATARRLAHVTYLSEEGMARKFERPPEPDPAPPADAREWLSSRYPVETYLDHQADTFLERFDALSYLYLSRIMDGFDPFAASGLRMDPTVRTLVLSFTSDWRFGSHHSARIVEHLRELGAQHLSVVRIGSEVGHDSFLLRFPGYQQAVATLLGE